MHKRKENRTYYVVVHGRKPGIYKNNEQAQSQVHSFPNGKMKKIKGLKAAKQYFSENRQTDSKNKIYYVVKRGRNPGLYLEKTKALQQIKNYPYGKVKRIKGYEQAHAYFHNEEFKEREKIPNISIDGSYIQNSSFSGYGFVVQENDQIIARDSGTILDFDIINLRSQGAELYAFIRALEWAITNSYKFIRIIYDSQVIIQMLDENGFKASKRSRGIVKLVRLYQRYKDLITVELYHKSDHESYETQHKEAHDLSRLMSNIIHNK